MSSTVVKRFDPPELGPAAASYSQANIVNGLVFLAGQAALDEEGHVVAVGDTYGQTQYALQRSKRLLEGVGSSLEHVVSAQVFITSEADFADYNKAWIEVFGSIRPGRATVISDLVIEGCLVEIVLTAAMAE